MISLRDTDVRLTISKKLEVSFVSVVVLNHTHLAEFQSRVWWSKLVGRLVKP